ncbi:tRNA (adenosine(37)-N6)-threonylcarbamoyltransferase complex ATPase subunit type 1 TsaE [Luteimonas terrae]|uniref:tRNA threonylcarbamoyladenosine biosynthesis protein TsaE n=1 Tax=Luteimonas terrae TaxID=1530191 RepID=A0ABU1XYF2_9GAMM|nr:tRNA (adenosine(37)-N6)-threonylcarbamoyltransferase complex ATPase subunit type 1 TsaE [Luteimonas terrae]MDR7193816.1 tRNA threonylcarbamoyladenosine biosynthesis protein TsaE [Luteimonas terrae]
MIRRRLPDEAATQRLAEVLATHQPRGAVVHLQGDLGAGKSTLARAWLRALGVTGTVRSPTYTLVERYPVDGGEALHLDLYRIGDAGELDFLGLDDIDAALWLVEWPERGAAALPPADLEIRLAIDGTGRSVELLPDGAAGTTWLAALIDDHRLSTLPEPKP